MAWQSVPSSKKDSLNSWLKAQGFSSEVTSAVQKSQLDKGDVGRLQQLRNSARGDGGALSKAQRRSIAPAKILVHGNKLVNFVGGLPVGDGKPKGTTSDRASGSEMNALRQEVTELKRLLRAASSPDPLGEATAAGAPAAARPQNGATKIKTCHTCGSTQHLRADCPVAQEVSKLERWQSHLEEDSCMLSPDLKEQQLAGVRARLATLERESTEAKERSVLPEKLLSSRRAEVQKRADALAAARQRLEASEEQYAKLKDQIEEQHQVVNTEAVAFRQAEDALEDAQRRLAGPVPAVSEEGPAPPPPPVPVPPNTLSARGLEALAALEDHINNLTEGTTMQLIEEEYQQLQEAAAGRPVQPMIAFVLDKLQREGARQLQVIGFELSKAPVAMVAEVAPTARVVPPERPRAEGGLGDNPRLPVRGPLKELPAADSKDTAAAVALAKRAEARASGLPREKAPPKDPLWVAINTAVHCSPQQTTVEDGGAAA